MPGLVSVYQTLNGGRQSNLIVFEGVGALSEYVSGKLSSVMNKSVKCTHQTPPTHLIKHHDECQQHRDRILSHDVTLYR